MEQVITLSKIQNDIAQITMHDRAARNTFSPAIIQGLINAFEEIKNDHDLKAVILTGYDNYFSCGGTKDELLAIYNKELAFDDLKFFTCPLFCEIPVIAAMQGHAIGGGFVFGCYADFMILGRENIYTTNFMKYGFTPGMGATLMVPARLGRDIGHEMLFSAENYRGGELQQRGISQRVVPKSEVLKEAIKLAKQLSEKPRLSLSSLKNHLNKDLKSQLPAIIEQELNLHQITFHQPEVKQRIEKFFGQ